MVIFDSLDIALNMNRIVPVRSFPFNSNLPNIRLDIGRIPHVNSFHAKYDTIDISLKKAEDSTLIYEII
jgi:hypothetical protein